MRFLKLAVLCLFLAGCGGGADDAVSKIQASVRDICKYEATAESVAAIVAAGAGGGAGAVIGVSAIAKAICSAVSVTKGVQALVGSCPSVNQVCIKGHFQ